MRGEEGSPLPPKASPRPTAAPSQSAVSSISNDDQTRAHVADLIRRMRMSRPTRGDQAWGGGIALIGAGCSVTAGIPAAGGVVDIALKEIGVRFLNLSEEEIETKSGKAIYDLLVQEGQIFEKEYGAGLYYELFDKYLDEPVHERVVIRKAIGQGRGRINWGHIRLGQIVAAHYLHTIFTTNFDQIILEGMVRADILPAVADGLEALTRVDPRPTTPQLVHIHGSLHNYARINSRRQIESVGNHVSLQSAFISLLRDAPFLLVVGYAGEEEGLVKPLREALQALPNKPVFWALRGTAVPDVVRGLLNLRDSGLRILIRLRTHNQKSMTAARAQAERKMSAHRS
jgi:hypothetical protein